jgi:ligand-binding sensor domain-containing protein
MTLNGGTVLFDGSGWKFMGGEGRGLFNDISSFAFPADGVAMGSQAGAVYLRRGAEVEALGKSFPTVTVFALSERGGTLYAGTSGGLFVWRGDGWTPALVPPAFEGKTVLCLLRVDLDLVVGGVNGVAVLDRSGRQRVVSALDGFPPGPASALAASGGTVFVGTDRGVVALSGWQGE